MTMTTTTTPPPPPTREDKRLLLVSVPRTASNLLVKILNIHQQPGIHTNAKAGYFFYDAYMASSVRGKQQHDGRLTEDDKTSIRTVFQNCLATIEEESKQARAANKTFFTKEHAFWFVNPAAMRAHADGKRHGQSDDQAQAQAHGDDLDAFRLDVPEEEYGSTRTFSEGNFTVLPDEYLRTWRIAFVIRHPALAWPSMYRAMLKIAKLGLLDEDGVKGTSAENMTLKWTRCLFDWCYRQPDEMVLPVIIDAHDVIHHPAAVLQFCEKTGLDTSLVQMEWDDPATTATTTTTAGSGGGWSDFDNKHKEASRIMLSTLNASKGIVKDKAPQTVDIPSEAEKWRAEFGDDAGRMLEKAVYDSMPDYEYLREKCVTPLS